MKKHIDMVEVLPFSRTFIASFFVLQFWFEDMQSKLEAQQIYALKHTMK